MLDISNIKWEILAIKNEKKNCIKDALINSLSENRKLDKAYVRRIIDLALKIGLLIEDKGQIRLATDEEKTKQVMDFHSSKIRVRTPKRRIKQINKKRVETSKK